MSEAEIFRVALALEVERDELRTALAASQAHAKALREALESHITDTGYCVQCDSANYHHEPDCLTGSALALPADTSALDAERAKEFVRGALAAWDKRPWHALGCDARTWDIATESHAEYLDTMRRAAAALRGPAPAEGGRETR